jgi:hypothetical protein
LGSLRVTLGKMNTPEQIELLIAAIINACEKIRE